MRKKVVERQRAEHCYLITLTKKVNNAPLSGQLSLLRDQFAQLRTRSIWRDHVLGGAYAYHLVGDERPDRWFPHLHAIVSTVPPEEKPFGKLPWGDQWEDITGDSKIVHVNKVWSIRNQPWRLANYVFKPVFEPFKDDSKMMGEFVGATKGKPLVNSMGSWRGDKTVVAEEEPCLVG